MRLPRRRSRPRASYRRAVEWIALNDDARDAEGLPTLTGYLSVVMTADLWGKAPQVVAADVMAYLNKGDR
jgi:hypothetical protein